jgi:hypothetical protein
MNTKLEPARMSIVHVPVCVGMSKVVANNINSFPPVCILMNEAARLRQTLALLAARGDYLRGAYDWLKTAPKLGGPILEPLKSLEKMVDALGLEPKTRWLRAKCSKCIDAGQSSA